MWVIHETSYDKFHTNGNRLYQSFRHMTVGGQTYTMNSQPPGIADEMKVEFPVFNVTSYFIYFGITNKLPTAKL